MFPNLAQFTIGSGSGWTGGYTFSAEQMSGVMASKKLLQWQLCLGLNLASLGSVLASLALFGVSNPWL